MADTARLILEVDAAVSLAQSNLRALSRSVQDYGSSADASVRKADAAYAGHTRTLGSARSAQMEMMHVVRASGDAFAAGASPIRIMATEMGRISEAAMLAGGALGGVGKFLAGPWGLAVMAGVQVLGMLAASFFSTGKSSKELKESVEGVLGKLKSQADQAARNVQANNIWASSIDGVREAQANLRTEIEKSLRVEVVQEQQHLQEAKGGLAKQQGFLTTAQVDEYNAGQDVKSARANASSVRGSIGAAGPAGTAAISQAEAKVTAAEARLAEATKRVKQIVRDIQASTIAIRAAEVPVATRTIDDAMDASKGENDRHDAALAAINVRHKRGTLINDNYTAALQREADRHKAAAAAADAHEAATRRLAKGNQEFGKTLNADEATAIARRAGFQVNSGTRTLKRQWELYNDPKVNRPGNPVAYPNANAPHVSGHALDIQMGRGVSIASIREAFRKEGVNLTRGFIEKGHYHVEWGGQKGRSAESIAKAEEAARIKGVRKDTSFGNEQARAEEELAKATLQLGASTKQRADLEAHEVELERNRLNNDVKAAISEGQMTKAQGDALIGLHNRIAAQKTANIRAAQADRVANDNLTVQAASLHTSEELEAMQGNLASTNKERRASALRLLDLSIQMETLELQAVINSSESTDIQKQIARARLGQLAAIQKGKKDEINDRYSGPGGKYVKGLKDAASDVGSQLEEVGVAGVKLLEDSLVGATKKALHLKGALGDVLGQLIRIAIQRAIIMPIAGALFGSGEAGGGGGLFGKIFGAVVKAVTKKVPGKASGGNVSAGSMFMVGEKGPELFIPPMSGSIMPNHQLKKMSAANSNHPQMLVVHVDKSDLFNVHVERISGKVVTVAAPMIISAAHRTTMGTISRPRI